MESRVRRLAALVFAGALLAVALAACGGGDDEESTTEAAATETAPATTEAAETETAPAETQPAETEETETEGATGDAAAGEEVWTQAGCGSCHTLSAAGSSGAVGPNLDELQPSFDAVVEQVTNGGGGMPAFGDTLSQEQIEAVATYVVESTSG